MANLEFFGLEDFVFDLHASGFADGHSGDGAQRIVASVLQPLHRVHLIVKKHKQKQTNSRQNKRKRTRHREQDKQYERLGVFCSQLRNEKVVVVVVVVYIEGVGNDFASVFVGGE